MKRIVTAPRTVSMTGPEFSHAQGAIPISLCLGSIFLHPGQTHVSGEPVILKMILGSCLGVFLFDPAKQIGGATHFMLPRWEGNGEPSARFGDVAMRILLRELHAAGCKSSNLQAKVYGGACMFQAFRSAGGDHFGRHNVEAAEAILSKAAIRVVEQDVLGDSGRKVSMISNTGEISLARIGG